MHIKTITGLTHCVGDKTEFDVSSEGTSSEIGRISTPLFYDERLSLETSVEFCFIAHAVSQSCDTLAVSYPLPTSATVSTFLT